MQTDSRFGSLTVQIDVPSNGRFKRVQLLVRALVLIAFGIVHQSGPGLFGLLYFFLPVIAAILITQRGGAHYLESAAPWLVSVLEWTIGFYAYMLFVCDVFPLGERERAVRLRVIPSGAPTTASALVRLVTTLPHVLVLAILGIASVVVAVIAALNVLLFETYPEAMRSFQQDVTVRIARVFVYHASIVDTYPTRDRSTDLAQSSATDNA